MHLILQCLKGLCCRVSHETVYVGFVWLCKSERGCDKLAFFCNWKGNWWAFNKMTIPLQLSTVRKQSRIKHEILILLCCFHQFGL